jgi:hypothetical protein
MVLNYRCDVVMNVVIAIAGIVTDAMQIVVGTL